METVSGVRWFYDKHAVGICFRAACTKTRNTGTPEHRNTGPPEHPGTPRNTGTAEKTRNTEFDSFVLFPYNRPCKK